MRFVIIITILLGSVLNSFAQDKGGNAFDFLNLPVSSHAAALGGDNISIIEDDATLLLHNPALLNNVSYQTISVGYMNYMKGVSDFSAQYTHMLDSVTTIAGHAQYVNYGSLKQTDAENRDLGEFSSSDLSIGVTVSRQLYRNLVGGITAKFLYSKLGAYTSTAVAVDLGLNYYDAERELSFSVVGKNLGGQISAFKDDFESIPFNLQLGVTKRFTRTPLRLSLTFNDMTHLRNAFFRHMIIGADIILSQQFYISGGYNLQRAHEMKIISFVDNEKQESSHGAGLSLGAGLQLERFKLHVSYAKYHVASSSLLFNAAFTL